MNHDIGFMMIKLHNNDTYNTIIDTIQTLQSNNIYNQTIIFNSYSECLDHKNIPILHLNQAMLFDGILFLFDLPSIILTSNFPNVKKRIFYTTDIPWSMSPSTPYNEWASLYNQSNLEILTQNEHLYNIYSICWKTPIGISQDFSYEQIKNFIQ